MGALAQVPCAARRSGVASVPVKAVRPAKGHRRITIALQHFRTLVQLVGSHARGAAESVGLEEASRRLVAAETRSGRANASRSSARKTAWC